MGKKYVISKERQEGIEQKLYNFYDKEKKIKSLKHKIEYIKKQIQQVQSEKMDYFGYKSPSWDEKVQTSSSNTSYAETELIRFEEKKEKRINTLQDHIEEIEDIILNIEMDNSILEYNVVFLEEDIKKMLKMLYKDKRTEISIGRELNLDQSVINKRKSNILGIIANWEDWGIRK